MKLLFLIIFVCLTAESFSWRFFHRGRVVGGNLGDVESNRNYKTTNGENPVQELWFDQILDHFTPGEQQLWKQRYYVNNQFFNEKLKGPVFLMIGGEGEATIHWMTNGTWIDYAKKFGALCFQLEHRYYGKSRPTQDMSTKNLLYLSSQQALADLANFIAAMNDKYNLSPDVKWIAFGGSYPGSLAAWLRNKYPHLVHGAMSASGPLLAKIDFEDYFRVVDEALATYNPKCVNAVKLGTTQIDILLRHMIGQRNINKLFKLCDPIENNIENNNDISNLFESLAGNFAGVVQYNKDNRKDSIGISLDSLCEIMVNESMGPPVTRLGAVNDLILNKTNQTCLDYKYDKMINVMKDVEWSSEAAEGGRQWTYQTCTEFGFFQTSSYKPQIFGDLFPAKFFIQQCTDIFGPKFDNVFLSNSINNTNILYGGLRIDVSNVVFVHGSIDPWHALGITTTLDPKAPAIYIDGTAHCANMYPERPEDLPQLKAARAKIAEYINSWISS